MKRRIRLLVVDDEARVRQGLLMRLALEPDLEVVGEAGDGEAALQLVLVLHPDIVVLDLLMPGMGGFQAIRMLQDSAPASRILAFSIRDEISTRRDAVSAGALAFIAKQEGPDRLLAAIRDLAHRHQQDGTADE